ncbi:MAG TPA: ABC transporter permease [Anaerolineaceae bacterium]
MKTAQNGYTSYLAAIGIVLFFLLGWEAAVWGFGLPPYLLPAPSRVLATLFTHSGVYLNAAFLTFGEAGAGLVIGVLAGMTLASLLVLRPGMEKGVMALAILVKSTPLVAVAPLLTIWLGFGILPKVVITALVTFFPVLVNALAGMQHPDPALLDLFAAWRADRRSTYLHLRLPASLPYLFAALKISAPLALVGAVVAEWTGAAGGLGRMMWLAYTNLNLPYLFAAIFVLAFAGMLVYSLLVVLERWIIFWNRSEDVI